MKLLEQRLEEQTESPETSRLEEARRIVEEYVQGLREILKQLRRRLH